MRAALYAVVMGLVVAGCAARQGELDGMEMEPPVFPPPAAPAPEVKTGPSALKRECGLAILGLAQQVRRGGMLLLGEMHGTREVPRFLAQAACQVAAAGTPVTVGLELPLETQERVRAYMESAGTEDDWLKLMEAPFWRSPYPDGRGSEAMALMLKQLHGLRHAQGLDVSVFAFDHPDAQGQERESAMAATVMEHVKAGPERFYLLLSGNIHPRTRAGLPWDAAYRPMGLLLKEQLGGVLALDMAYNNGTAWICSMDSRGVVNKLDCGVRQARGRDNGERFFVHLWDGPDEAGYHGVFYVGAVSASLPAVEMGLGRPGSSAPPI